MEGPFLCIQLYALFDLQSNLDVSIASLVDDPGKCECLRCRYERMSAGADLKSLVASASMLKRLGGSYLADQKLDVAEALLWQLYNGNILDEDQSADVWHMIGAVYLSQDRFLKAQAHWREGVDKHRHDKFNAELILQTAKQRSYRYFDKYNLGERGDDLPEYRSLGSFVFLTPKLVDAKTCCEIIGWAEKGKWTEGRHYAVPTTDVPVHAVPELLS